jgi:membrane-bound lytic murein transglycosylase D
MPLPGNIAKPRGARRDWRLAAVSACCSTLGCACLLLAACSGNGVRQSAHVAETPAPVPLRAPATAIAPTDITLEQITSTLPQRIVSPWQRLRDRYAMPGCNYSPTVQRFASTMAASPRHLNAALKQAMPFLLVVTDQIEKYDMPGEFAFLPWVESSYTMLPPNGDGVAGMWQLMPQTARESGLQIDAEYDGRLDVYSSSRTALVLLKQYKEEFGDWRLANMAFNAGENSIKQVLGKRQSITPLEIERLRLNQTNYEHLTKLLALACIVSAPERFHVELPEPAPDDIPAVLDLPAPVDLRLAATIAGIDLPQLQRWNPAYLKSRMPEHGPYHLLVPATRRAAIERALGMLPQYTWRDWRDMKLQQPQSVEMLSMAYDLDARALAAINGIDATATLPAGTQLLLPGHGGNAAVAVTEPVIALAATATGTATTTDSTCTVHPGDTLWNIARRYGVRIEDLLHWNRLPRDATLRLGQRILLTEPGAESLAR